MFVNEVFSFTIFSLTSSTDFEGKARDLTHQKDSILFRGDRENGETPMCEERENIDHQSGLSIQKFERNKLYFSQF